MTAGLTDPVSRPAGSESAPPPPRPLLPAPRSTARATPTHDRHPRPGAPGSSAERALAAFGADLAFVGAVLGDLAEEYALRAQDGGAGAARRWYAREALRSAPHLARHAVAHAIRHGTARQRVRLAGLGAGVCVAVAGAALAWVARAGPPTHLVPGTAAGAADDGIVVNSERPVQLPVRVLDARGHALAPTGVRYEWASGAAVPVSPTGVVTCTRRGDAVVRAALGPLVTPVLVHCEPVRALGVATWGGFVLGDPGRDLAVDAVGADGRPVTRVAARLRVEDSTVATLDGGHLRPLRPGWTVLDVEVGDHTTGAVVTVYAPVATFEGLRPDQRYIVAPVRVRRDAAVRWPLPLGLFWLSVGPGTATPPMGRSFGAAQTTAPVPTLAVDGPVLCMPALRPGVRSTHCLARETGATVTITHPGPGAPDEVTGMVALERQTPH